MSVEAEPYCRVQHLREQAEHARKLADNAVDNDHLLRAAREFDRQADEHDCTCQGMCGVDEG